MCHKAFKLRFIGAVILVAQVGGYAHAGEIFVDGVACQLADAINAANRDEAVYGCSAGDGADSLILLTDVSLPIGQLPRITSDITLVSGKAVNQACNCEPDSEATPEPGPPRATPEPGPPRATPEPGPPRADTDTPVPPADTDTPVPPADTDTPVPRADTDTPVPPADTATPSPPADTATPSPPAVATATITPTVPIVPGLGTVSPRSGPGATATPPVPEECIHMVALGENLYRIALTYDMSVSQISGFNNLLSNDRLTEGQELVIPYDHCVPYFPQKG